MYIVIKGSGQILLGDGLLDLVQGDIVRVAPETEGALKANNKGIFIICSGAIPKKYPNNPNARHLIDDDSLMTEFRIARISRPGIRKIQRLPKEIVSCNKDR